MIKKQCMKYCSGLSLTRKRRPSFMDGTLGAAVGFTKDFARTLKKIQIKLLLILIIFVFLTLYIKQTMFRFFSIIIWNRFIIFFNWFIQNWPNWKNNSTIGIEKCICKKYCLYIVFFVSDRYLKTYKVFFKWLIPNSPKWKN